ncbi:MAG: hypothetical protein JWO44_1305 [Bacteroidetes bacterium]|nr:hypothetical protein [Bacteroidota bacterium]
MDSSFYYSLAVFILCFLLPGIMITIDFIRFLFTGKRLYNRSMQAILDFAAIIVFPALCLLFLDESENDCCDESAIFSPEHRLTIYILILLCVIFYFYSSFKKSVGSPVLEVISNCFLLLAIPLNGFISYQVGFPIALVWNLPIVFLFILQLAQNHRQLLEYSKEMDPTSGGIIVRLAWKILQLNPFVKIPLLLILCLPLMVLITAVLLLFGQKPDSIVRAFTDTYKHGFSQLDYMCDNVECGGHFLCSVAANGHKGFVKPERYGERGGGKIICNRQLLVSNAFEELMEQRLPKIHKVIRHNYNKVGNLVHRHYGIFNNKFVADAVYVLMKPLEWFFVLVLYTFDSKPENRIARQYLSAKDRKSIREKMKVH